jgi:tetratricopeptide (TPR) repeat protein
MKIKWKIVLTLVTAALTACSANLSEMPLSTVSVPVDKEIDAAMSFIEKVPDSAAGYNQLAALYIKRARETGDFSLNKNAENAVHKALAVAPADESALKLQASLHLTFHRFAEGLELGKRLLKDYPDDAFVYGVLTDANAELGNYPEAVAAAQRMVDLKPNSNSYARVAHLRSLNGDHKGAVDMYKLAARTADPQDKEAQSWCLTQLGQELWRNGKYSEAEKVFDEALQVFPGYHLALAGKGRSLASRGEHAAAVQALTEAKDRFPNTDTIILFGDVYSEKGEPEKAREMYELVQGGEEKLGELHDAHRVALFWADHDMNLDEALVIAREDYKQVKDIYAADILAWCLYKKGHLTEAKAMVTEAMRLKTKDARIYYHAGMIELALNKRQEAKRMLEKALSLNPGFDIVQAAHSRKALESIK